MANVETLKTLFEQTLTLNPAARKSATDQLQSLSSTDGFVVALLKLIENEGVPESTRHSAVIYFKNHVKKGWDEEDSSVNINGSDREIIKENIITLMCNTPAKIMSQLSEAIRIIGEHDFPEAWQSLLPSIKKQLFGSSDFRVIIGMLETMNILFKMFRDKPANDPLWLKLKYVLEFIQTDITNLFTTLVNEFKSNPRTEIMTGLRLVIRIFYSLNWQTIPEYFEDNLQLYAENFAMLLETQNPGNDEGLMKVQTAVLNTAKLYAEKYDEEFAIYLPRFTESTWSLLMRCRQSEVYDELVCTGFSFLTVIVSRQSSSVLFKQGDVLQTLCEKLIVKNLTLNETDYERLSDNPMEYIRGDLEGGDVTSRRTAATNMLRAMTNHLDKEISSIALNYLKSVFQLDSGNCSANLTNGLQNAEAIRRFDVGINLFIAVGSKKYTFIGGTTEANDKLAAIFTPMFESIVLTIISNNQNVLFNGKPEGDEVHMLNKMLLCDALRCVFVFRRQLDPQRFLQLDNVLVTKWLALNKDEDFFVANSYAAAIIERQLAIKDKYTYANTLKPMLQPLLTNLFTLIQHTVEEHEEYNPYLVKCLMRTVSSGYIAHNQSPDSDGVFVSVCGVIFQKLIELVKIVANAPKSPVFTHYVFECLAILVRLQVESNQDNLKAMEAVLFPIFEVVLKSDIAEIIPYVFQLMSQLLELNQTGTISPGYASLFPALLHPSIWQNKGNTAVLVRLLSAYLSKAPSTIVPNLKGLLGVFQQLMASSVTEFQGLKLLFGVPAYLPRESYAEFLPQVFQIIFMKFEKNKTDMIAKRQFALFMSILVKRIGAKNTADVLNGLGNGLVYQVVQFIISPSLKSVHSQLDKKIISVGMTDLLTEYASLFITNKNEAGPVLLRSVVEMLAKGASSDEKAVDSAEDQLADLEETGYAASYSKLIYAAQVEQDPFPDVNDCRMQLLQGLKSAAQRHAGVLDGFVARALTTEESKQGMQVMMQAGNIQRFN